MRAATGSPYKLLRGSHLRDMSTPRGQHCRMYRYDEDALTWLGPFVSTREADSSIVLSRPWRVAWTAAGTKDERCGSWGSAGWVNNLVLI